MTPDEALSLMQRATQWWLRHHARQRMRERGITERDIYRAVAHATSITASADHLDAWVVTGPDLSDEAIVAVIRVEIILGGGGRNIVITVWGV